MQRNTVISILIAISAQTLLIGISSGGNPHYKYGIGRGFRSQKSDTQEEGTMLGVLENERFLNNILKQFGRNRQAAMERADDVTDTGSIFENLKTDSEKQVFPEYTESLPENTNRDSRHLGFQSHHPICKLERRIVSLNNDEYEYRPAYYEEVKCIHKEHEQVATNEICSSVGFACVQWNKTIHLTRRLYTSNCWESNTLVIPAGCECMWPAHKLGEIRVHV